MQKVDFESFYFEWETLPINGADVNIIKFCGKISSSNSYEISRKISKIFENGVYNVILDLNDLEYINSVGVAMLLTMIKSVNEHNGVISVGGLGQNISTIFNLLELSEKIKIFKNVEEAKSGY